MAFTFRPAVRENVGLLIGLSGASGSGKTYTAMRLAKGIAGDKPFAVIDTEAGRANHYADQFRFDHGDLKPPFTPERYTEAIVAADQAGYAAILVDSASHEWAGEGGILDWQEAELDRMAGDDWKKREAVKMASWIKPKMAHKKMVQRLLQVRAHLILCFRAEPKIEMVRVNGKTEVREKQSLTGVNGWIPICEKNLPYELTVSLLLMADRPGVQIPIKLQEQHKALFPLDRVIDESSGQRLAEWAHGATPVPRSPVANKATNESTTPARASTSSDWPGRLANASTSDELDAVWRELNSGGGSLGAAQMKALRAAYERRRQDLSVRPADQEIGQGDIQWS